MVGILASAVTGYAAVWGTLWLVRTHSFFPFVVYRIALGVTVLGLARLVVPLRIGHCAAQRERDVAGRDAERDLWRDDRRAPRP